MLVISRRRHERILIGDDIEIVVVNVHRSSVKLGVNAPKPLTVLRAEIHEEVPRIVGWRWGIDKGHLVAPDAGARIHVDALLELLRAHGYLVDVASKS